MKYIKFCDEVLRVPESVTFWIMNMGHGYSHPYCINMSVLEKQNAMGEPTTNSIIRSEGGYKTLAGAQLRLDQLLDLLNSEYIQNEKYITDKTFKD